MKVLALVLSSVVATLLLIGSLVVVLVVVPKTSPILFLLPTLAFTFFIYGPLSFGSATFYWDFGSSDDSRRYLRRYLWIVGGLELLAAVALIVFAVMTGAPIWLPIVFIALCAILMVVAPLIGRALRRYDDGHSQRRPSWVPTDASIVRRKIRTIVITFVAALVVFFALFTLVFAQFGDKGDGVASTALFAFEFAAIAGAFAAIIVSIPLARDLRGAGNRDITLTRKVAKVVLRGKKIELNEVEETAAARYAAAASVYFPFMLTYLVLLYLGIGSGLVKTIADGTSDTSMITVVELVFLAVVLVVFFPMQIVRTRRARQYAIDHDDLLKEHALSAQ